MQVMKISPQQIKKLLVEAAPKEKKERMQYLLELEKRGVAAKPPEIKYKAGANIKNMPPRLKAIVERVDHDEEYYREIKNLVELTAAQMIKAAQNQQTFCEYFRFASIEHKLLKIYGITAQELSQEMAKIGFHELNRGLNSPITQTLALAYIIALYKDDQTMRQLTLMIIMAFIWNKRIKHYFKVACNPNIARYVTQYMLKKNSQYFKHGTPLATLYGYYVLIKDEKFSNYIRQDVTSKSTGIVKIFNELLSTFNTLIQNLANKYYEAHEKGWEEVVNTTHNQAYGNGEMVESRETFRNILDQLLDKFNKNQMLASKVLLSNDVKHALKMKFNMSDKIINDYLNPYFDDEDNHEDLKMGFEYFLMGAKPDSDEEFCSYDMSKYLTNVGNAKKNEYFNKLKIYRKQVTAQIFKPEENKISATNYYRLENMVLYALLLYFKKITCSKI